MKTFFNLVTGIPVAGCNLSVTSAQPRKPTAFERMIVHIIGNYKDSELKNSSITDIFGAILKLNDIEIFLDQAMEELFSASVNVLRTNAYATSYKDLPISSIDITEMGEEMLIKGQLPSAPRTETRMYYYDFVTNMIFDSKPQLRDGDHPFGMGINTFGNASPLSIAKEYFQLKKKDAVITDVTEDISDGRRVFHRLIKVSIALNGEEISLTTQEDKVQNYLQKLSLDAVKKMCFTEQFSHTALLSDTIHSIHEHNSLRLFTPAEYLIKKMEGDICVGQPKTDPKVYDGKIFTILLNSSANEYFAYNDKEANGVLYLNKNVFWEPNAYSDLDIVREIATYRFNFNNQSLLLPVGTEYDIDHQCKHELTSEIIKRILSDSAPYRYAFAFLVAGDNEEYFKLILSQLTAEENIGLILREIQSHFANKWKRVIDMDALVRSVFVLDKISSIPDLGRILDSISSISISPKLLSEIKKSIEIKINGCTCNTLKDWELMASLYLRVSNSCPDSHYQKAKILIPKDSLEEQQKFALAFYDILKKLRQESKYGFFVQSVLSTMFVEKTTLDNFVQILGSIVPDLNKRKEILINVSNFVEIPTKYEDVLAFAHICQVNGIPLPNNIFRNDVAAVIVDRDFTSFINEDEVLKKIQQISPLLDLNVILRSICSTLGIVSIVDYTQPSDTKKIKELCVAWQKKWLQCSNFFDEQDNYCQHIVNYVSKILEDIDELERLANRKKYIVFDTCALRHKPDILKSSRASTHIEFVIPKVVIQELDIAKQSPDTSENEKSDVRAIIRYIKNNNLQGAEANTDLLPEEYRNNITNDDRILSVALLLRERGEDVIVVTDDINFQNKINGEKISSFTMDEFYRKIKRKEI